MTRPAILIPVVLLSTLLACAPPPAANPPSPSGAEEDPATALADAIRAASFMVDDAGMVEQPFFDVAAHVFVVEGDDMQVYVFGTAAAAETAASRVAPSGHAIGTTKMSWMAPPHFFRKGRLIVNYLGTAERTLTELRRQLGPQFAGAGMPPLP